MDLSKTKLDDLGTMSGIGPPTVQAAQLPPGKLIAERYEIVRAIGRGGMGVVYEALDRLRGTSVALKFLAPELVASDTATQRFLNEARIASDLAHDNIVRVYDVARHENSYFLSMELLRGQSLRQLMQEIAAAGQKMSVAQAVGIAKDVAHALAYAHRTTIHRDIKPENIWILADGKAKVMDFGIARLQSQTSGLTKTATALGTAYYMAPEQLVGTGQVDHRADQYSLGVVFYEMLTGLLPIGKLKPVRAIRPHVAKAIDVAIETMLAGGMEDRYPSDALCEQALAALPVSEKPSRWGKALSMAAAVAGLAIAAAFFLGRPDRPPATPSPITPPAQALPPTPAPVATLSELIVIPEDGKLVAIGLRPAPGATPALPFAELARQEGEYRQGKPSFTAGVLRNGKYVRGQLTFDIACTDFDATIEGDTHELRAVCKQDASGCVTMSNGKFDGMTLTKFDVPKGKTAATPGLNGVMLARAALVEMKKGRSCEQ